MPAQHTTICQHSTLLYASTMHYYKTKGAGNVKCHVTAAHEQAYSVSL